MNLTVDLSLLINPTLDQCLESILTKPLFLFPHGSLAKPRCLLTKPPRSITILFLLVICLILLAILTLIPESCTFILAQLVLDKLKRFMIK